MHKYMGMNPVVHFEMPYVDKKRMVDFYAKAFGWESQMLGGDMENYVLVTTTERGDDGFPKRPGSINGGFYKKLEDVMLQYPSVVIAVDDIKESIEKIKKEGGSVLGELQDIPGYGLYISLLDTEGNRVGLMQPYQRM